MRTHNYINIGIYDVCDKKPPFRVKAAFGNFPGIKKEISEKEIGVFLNFLGVLYEKEIEEAKATFGESACCLEDTSIEVITSDNEEHLEGKGWIPLHEIIKGNYESLPNYKGEQHLCWKPMRLDLSRLYPNFNPKYIYIRKRKDIKLEH